MSGFFESRRFLFLVAVVDLLLIAGAVYMSHRPPPAYTGDVTSVIDPSQSPSPITRSDAAVVGPVFLAASPTGALVRVVRGSCDSRNATRAEVSVAASPDSPLSTAAVPQLQEALGVGRTTDNDIAVVGATADCKVHSWVSADAGRTWTMKGPKQAGIWYLSTDTSAEEVFNPQGKNLQTSCAPRSVSGQGNKDAVVICKDMVGLVSAGVSGSAVPLVGVGGAVQKADLTVLALAPSNKCAAVVYPILGANQPKTRAKCVGDGTPLAMTMSKRALFAQVGDKIWFSNNDGKTFKLLSVA